jgi:hypothetical protein
MSEAAGTFDRFEPVPRIKLELAADVQLEQLQEVVARLYKNTGCDMCGRLSFTIEAIDPELVLPVTKGLREVPVIKNIQVQ